MTQQNGAPEKGRKKSARPKRPNRQKQQKSLLQVTNRAIDRLCAITADEELMQSIDIKDLKNLTSSVKELLSLSGELDGDTGSGGIIILPEVELHDGE